MELKDGRFSIQGLAVTEICQQVGTPIYVYDADKIVSQINTLKQAFKGPKLRIKYAVKALTNISILRLIKEQGAEVDAVSIEEIKLCLHAGFLPAQIQYTPNCVDLAEIVEAVELGVTINIDNLPMLEKFGARYGRTYPCGVRLNPHVMAGGNLKISTGHSQSKFGISIYQLPQIVELREKYKMRINGL
ncbi:MAG: diaminopimelate decarboxylase, partial [Flammeovirgaceae bacterium]|nr:diaminopimelate decarboxylase [Flammeovirgaceae bacterium]